MQRGFRPGSDNGILRGFFEAGETSCERAAFQHGGVAAHAERRKRERKREYAVHLGILSVAACFNFDFNSNFNFFTFTFVFHVFWFADAFPAHCGEGLSVERLRVEVARV